MEDSPFPIRTLNDALNAASCPLCERRYGIPSLDSAPNSDIHHQPMILPCGHTFCEVCLTDSLTDCAECLEPFYRNRVFLNHPLWSKSERRELKGLRNYKAVTPVEIRRVTVGGKTTSCQQSFDYSLGRAIAVHNHGGTAVFQFLRYLAEASWCSPNIGHAREATRSFISFSSHPLEDDLDSWEQISQAGRESV